MTNQIVSTLVSAAEASWPTDSISMEWPVHVGRSWTKAPLDRERRFHRIWARVARASQRFMREQFPPLYFSDPESYSNIELAWPVVLFAASTPHFAKRDNSFTYEVLDNHMIDKFYRSASCHLPAVLAKVEADLLARGLNTMAKLYAPDRSREIAGFVKRSCHPMHTLLHSESMLLDEFFRLSQSMREIAADPRALRTAPAVAEKFSRILHSRLRRFYRKAPAQQLAVPLFLAVTNAMDEALHIVK